MLDKSNFLFYKKMKSLQKLSIKILVSLVNALNESLKQLPIMGLRKN
jgi:hypothetical protein